MAGATPNTSKPNTPHQNPSPQQPSGNPDDTVIIDSNDIHPEALRALQSGVDHKVEELLIDSGIVELNSGDTIESKVLNELAEKSKLPLSRIVQGLCDIEIGIQWKGSRARLANEFSGRTPNELRANTLLGQETVERIAQRAGLKVENAIWVLDALGVPHAAKQDGVYEIPKKRRSNTPKQSRARSSAEKMKGGTRGMSHDSGIFDQREALEQMAEEQALKEQRSRLKDNYLSQDDRWRNS